MAAQKVEFFFFFFFCEARVNLPPVHAPFFLVSRFPFTRLSFLLFSRLFFSLFSSFPSCPSFSFPLLPFLPSFLSDRAKGSKHSSRVKDLVSNEKIGKVRSDLLGWLIAEVNQSDAKIESFSWLLDPTEGEWTSINRFELIFFRSSLITCIHLPVDFSWSDSKLDSMLFASDRWLSRSAEPIDFNLYLFPISTRRSSAPVVHAKCFDRRSLRWARLDFVRWSAGWTISSISINSEQVQKRHQ